MKRSPHCQILRRSLKSCLSGIVVCLSQEHVMSGFTWRNTTFRQPTDLHNQMPPLLNLVATSHCTHICRSAYHMSSKVWHLSTPSHKYTNLIYDCNTFSAPLPSCSEEITYTSQPMRWGQNSKWRKLLDFFPMLLPNIDAQEPLDFSDSINCYIDQLVQSVCLEGQEKPSTEPDFKPYQQIWAEYGKRINGLQQMVDL